LVWGTHKRPKKQETYSAASSCNKKIQLQNKKTQLNRQSQLRKIQLIVKTHTQRHTPAALHLLLLLISSSSINSSNENTIKKKIALGPSKEKRKKPRTHQ
jgi:hypothetical protein